MSSTKRKRADGTVAKRIASDAYNTPDRLAFEIVDVLVELGVLKIGMTVLEPHVGGGAFVRALLRHPALRRAGVSEGPGQTTEGPLSIVIHALDINPDAPGLELVRSLGEPHEAGVGDFLPFVSVGAIQTRNDVKNNVTNDVVYDLILGNPPYSGAESHLVHALNVLGLQQEALEIVNTAQRPHVCFLMRAGFALAVSRRELLTRWPIATELRISPRPSFTGGGTDGTDYAAFVWPIAKDTREAARRDGARSRILYSNVAWHKEPSGAVPKVPVETMDTSSDTSLGRSSKPTRSTLGTSPQGAGEMPDAAKNKARNKGTTMYVKSIESNAKGLDNKPIELGPKTLILGPSGSGKSRIINVIELALTGRCSDIAGKDRSMPADLLALAPQREGKLWAQATLSDGSVSRWETESQGAGSAKTPTVKNTYADKADSVLPLRALAEAIGGKPDKARRFFLRTATGQVTTQDVLSRLPPAIGTVYSRAAGGMDPIDALLALRDDAHQKHLAARTQATAAESVVNAAAPTVPRPTEAQLAQAQDAVSAMDTLLEVAIRTEEQQRQGGIAQIRAESDANKRRELQAALAEWIPQRAHAADVLRAWQEQLNALPQPDIAQQARAARGGALLLLSEWQTGKQTDACALCASPVTMAQLEAQKQRILAACAQLADGAKRGEIEKAITAWQQHHIGIEAHVKTAEQQLSTLQASLSDVQFSESSDVMRLPGTLQPVSNAMVASEARTKRDVAQRALVELRTAEAAWVQTNRMRNEAQTSAEARDQHARVRDACQGAADELLAASVKQFEAKVQKYLPAADTFALRLSEGKREVFQLGLLRPTREGSTDPASGAVVHTALSGAEWARVTAAVAAAIADGNTLSVIIPEERAYDPATLATVMRALTGANAQVILTSPVKFAGRAPAGWTIVEVAAAAAANAATEAINAGPEAINAGSGIVADVNAQLGARGPVDPASFE